MNQELLPLGFLSPHAEGVDGLLHFLPLHSRHVPLELCAAASSLYPAASKRLAWMRFTQGESDCSALWGVVWDRGWNRGGSTPVSGTSFRHRLPNTSDVRLADVPAEIAA